MVKKPRQSEKKNKKASRSETLAEKYFRQIFEQHYDAILLLKPRVFSCFFVNQPAANLFGLEQSRLLADLSAIFRTPDEFALFCNHVGGAAGGDFILPFIMLRHADGHDLPCSIRGKSISFSKSRAIFCSIRDISEKIRMEERESQLQAKMIHANKMTSLGTLASGMAHEINNPNNFILSNAQMMKQIWHDADLLLQNSKREIGDFHLGGIAFDEAHVFVPHLLDGIIEGATRINEIIHHFKDFVRPGQQGGQQPGWVNLNEVARFAMRILENEIKTRTNHFRAKFAEDLPAFPGDSQKIEQVIINLLQNALQALPGPQAGVTINTKFLAEENVVVLQVQDQGAGIAADELPRLMEPFFTTRQQEGGTGLGLYICYGIVREHQGTIEILSQLGSGTEVNVRFPATLPKERACG